MKVYILILNYNGWRDTQECLESVLNQDYSNYQVIVVDNNSPNQSMNHLVAWAKGEEIASVDNKALQSLSTPHSSKPVDFILYDKGTAEKGGIPDAESQLNNPIVFIQAGENKGFAAGNNIGIKYALAKDDFEYIWLLNNDTVIKPQSLGSLVDFSCQNNSGITGSALMYYDNPALVQCYGGRVSSFFGTTKFNKSLAELNNQLDYIVGAAFLINKKVIKKIGLLPEEYFLYYEDTDYSLNAILNDFSIGVDIDSLVYHKEGGSIGLSNRNNNNKEELFDLLSIKNRVLFHNKYFQGGLGLYAGLFITILNRVKRRQINRVYKILLIFPFFSSLFKR